MTVVQMDAQIALNTPALTGGTSVQPPHLDRLDKLFLGLLYLRVPGDNSKGADLELLSALDDQPVYGPLQTLSRDRVRLVRTIRYRSNTLVLILNTPHSLHGVTAREATPHPRYFINLVAKVAEPLFAIKSEAAEETAASPKEALAGRFGRGRWLRQIWHGLSDRAREMCPAKQASSQLGLGPAVVVRAGLTHRWATPNAPAAAARFRVTLLAARLAQPS